MTQQALALGGDQRFSKRAVQTKSKAGSQTTSFMAYLPALIVAIIKDCLDIVFFLLAFVPFMFPVAVLFQFVFGIGLGALSASLLFLFTQSNASFINRFLRFVMPQSADSIIPGVSLLPLATLSVILVYTIDKKSQKGILIA